jgi:tight adherence protein B
MNLLYNDWIFVSIVGVCVFVISYLWSDKALDFFKKQSLGQREIVIKYLDSMFVDIDKKRITLILMLVSVGLGVAVFLLLWPNIIMGMLIGIIVTLAGWNAPRLVVKSLFEKRCNFFVDQMVDGLTIMGNGVRSGLSITQSMERVVENLGNPIAQEFGLVLSQIRLGRSVEEALTELAERIDRPDVVMFVTAVNILKETGGNMAETFSTIVTTIRERQKVEKKIQALTAQGLMQGMIITLIPFGIMSLFLIVDPSYVMPMFTTSIGLLLLMVMIAMQLIGGFMILKIVKIRV